MFSAAVRCWIALSRTPPGSCAWSLCRNQPRSCSGHVALEGVLVNARDPCSTWVRSERGEGRRRGEREREIDSLFPRDYIRWDLEKTRSFFKITNQLLSFRGFPLVRLTGLFGQALPCFVSIVPVPASPARTWRSGTGWGWGGLLIPSRKQRWDALSCVPVAPEEANRFVSQFIKLNV